GGLGISARDSASALSLPREVDFAFAPYSSDVGRWAAAARRGGHEILLELPLEPESPDGLDPGPHTLRIAATAPENEARLDWALSRFTGYAGVMNLAGERFLADDSARASLTRSLKDRGLFFLANGPQARIGGEADFRAVDRGLAHIED